MTELDALHRDVSLITVDPLPLEAIKQRAHRNRKRRARRRIATLTAIIVVITVSVVTAVGVGGGPSPRLATSGSQIGKLQYVGMANVVFQTSSGLLYTVDQSSDSIYGLDPNSNPPFAVRTTIPLPFAPGVVAVSDDGSTAYVSPYVPEEQGGSNALYRVDLTTGLVTPVVVDPQGLLGNIALGPDGQSAYGWSSDAITPIALANGTTQAPIVLSGVINDFVISPSGSDALAATTGPNGPAVSEVNLANGQVLETINTDDLTVGGTTGKWIPEYVSYSGDGTVAYVLAQSGGTSGSNPATEEGLITIDPSDGRVLASDDLGQSHPAGLLVTEGGSEVFVLQDSSDDVGSLTIQEIGTDGSGGATQRGASTDLGIGQPVAFFASPNGSVNVVTADWNIVSSMPGTAATSVTIKLPGSAPGAPTLQPTSP